MGLTASRLKELGLIDYIIGEPLGAAHRDVDAIAEAVKQALLNSLEHLETIPIDKLLDQRYERMMSYGNYNE
jgi:acetyl-CoA carboxylase carboxyl transferase subunit alpha